jgi:HK97 family phage portal protein
MLRSLRTSSPALEERNQVLPWGIWDNSRASAAGVNVSAQTATQSLTVFGCVSLIADTIATLPTDVFRDNGNEHTEVPKPSWLDRPNDYSTFVDFCTQTLWSLLLDGNAYWVYGLNNSFGIQTPVVVLDPGKVDIDHERMTLERERTGRPSQVRYLVAGEPFNGHLLHIRGIMRPGQIKGLSPVEAARQSVGISLAAEEFAARFYSNNATLGGVIKTDADLTSEQAQKLQASWMSSHSGLANAHKPGVLDNGASWESTSLTWEQSQFLQSRNFQAAEIAGQMFLIDPEMLGIVVQGKRQTYANIEQQGIHLVQFSLLRWIVRLEAAFSQLLPNPQYLKFKVAGLERADLSTRYAAYRVANPDVAWLADQEIRDLEDLGPVPAALATQNKPAPPPKPVAPQPFPLAAPKAAESNGVHV